MTAQIDGLKNFARTVQTNQIAWFWQPSFIDPWVDTMNAFGSYKNNLWASAAPIILKPNKKPSRPLTASSANDAGAPVITVFLNAWITPVTSFRLNSDTKTR